MTFNDWTRENSVLPGEKKTVALYTVCCGQNLCFEARVKVSMILKYENYLFHRTKRTTLHRLR